MFESITFLTWDRANMTATFTINDDIELMQLTVPMDFNTEDLVKQYLLENANIIWTIISDKKIEDEKNPDMSAYIGTIIKP